ncbi:transmembrane protein C5orf28-like [Scleropages formosus]|uniref:Transmembrane protein 267 n=1 Tax=Scleropages formosus TaxID=113540 RepID=A0A0P7U4W5_SCLFO|nr:transmembrane protein 267-like [Scleropages formosus]XP_018613941.1 transmembrane protein 267-like [Scleropages formosus]XP_018613942.1 transmembrane protein 267-like [Scleropages formosus]XP_018613944.1 transmembrane protein 267-like [Scleropages formosus]XP_029115255.1 transmembrane protein 267-like [Scleropages formosus]KPP69181.1 transmembrane protein C5orf28-like [Scleropages formosus]
MVLGSLELQPPLRLQGDSTTLHVTADMEMTQTHTLLQTLSLSSVVGSLGLGIFCVCADHFVRLPHVQQHTWLHAVADNVIHGTIGLWSWAIVIGLRKSSDVCEAMLAGCLAAVIDLDHFYQAQSLSLKAAVNLSQRPPLHCSSLIPVLCGSLWLLVSTCRLGAPWHSLPWLLFLSLASHHVRDATRHGLWVWPFGSTEPLPYWLYVALTSTMPHLSSVLISFYGTREATSQKYGTAYNV